MAVMIQMQVASAVTEIDEDACVGSSRENGTTMIMFALRQHDFHQELGTQATLWWRTDSSHVDVHELSTFHHPILYRCIVAQGSSLDGQKQRRDFTPAIKGVSTSQPMSHSVIRLACDLAVVCGVSRRHSARLFAALCLRPMPKSSIKRWMDDMGSPVPAPEERLRHLLARTPATACPMDGDDPLGTDHGVMVVKDEHDRLLITHEAESDNGEDARPLLQQVQALGLNVTAAFSDDSPSFTAAITAVSPHARFPADPCHTVQHSWGHLKKSLLSSRRKVKASGAEQNDEHLLALAKQLWQWRWSLLKKPAPISEEETQAIAERERADAE